MLASKDYGTLEATVDRKATSKRAVMLVAGVVACAVIATVTFGAGFAQVNSVVDSNTGRSEIADVHEDFVAHVEDLCNNGKNRFVTSAVVDGQLQVSAKGASTSHWEGDFNTFMGLLKESQAASTDGVAFGVYNLPAFDDASQETFSTYPTFVTYLGEGVDATDYVGGTYMGAAMLASKCAYWKIVAYDGDSYKDACTAANIGDFRCNLVDTVQCPFGDSVENPCHANACEDVYSFTAAGGFPEGCCDAIKSWCEANPNGDGCGAYAWEMIEETHCEFSEDRPEQVSVFYDQMASYVVPEPVVEEEVVEEVPEVEAEVSLE